MSESKRSVSSWIAGALAGCLLVGACADEGHECGEGTVVVDGVCVASGDGGTDAGSGDGTGEPSFDSNGEGGGDDGGGDDDGADDVADETGTSPPTGDEYGPCPGGSDVECDGGTPSCIESLNTCSAACFGDRECPAGPDGTAVQRCLISLAGYQDVCALSCEGGLQCPTGMVCDATYEVSEIAFCANP
jgi:hypothetical protein